MLDFGFYNMDCMEGMKQFPDDYFDLAIVDPPYGSGGYLEERNEIRSKVRQIPRTGFRGKTYPGGGPDQSGGVADITVSEPGRNTAPIRTGGTWAKKFGKKLSRGILRQGKIILTSFSVSHAIRLFGGGNYFQLPPARCFLVWRKINVPEKFTMAMAEYAWTSFNLNAKVFDYSAVGQKGRFHPTQKPVALYKWILTNYAKPGDKILDTHVGSASSLIACYDLGFDYVGFEIDEEYYRLAKKRLDEEMAQVRFNL